MATGPANSRSRSLAAAGVLLLHGGLLVLLTPSPGRQLAVPALQLRLIEEVRPAPRAAAEARPAARAAPRRAGQTPDLALDQAPGQAPGLSASPSQAITAPAADTSAPPSAPEPIRPLDLRLPGRVQQAPKPPTLHEQIRADARANSPREGAADRMANALGAKGWTVIELADGGRKVMGPFGECFISRKSMMTEVEPGNPRWAGLPDKVFGCGGIEKGSLKHERPK